MANSESEGFPSQNDYNSILILNDELFDERVSKLNNGEVIKLYEYVLEENQKENEAKEESEKEGNKENKEKEEKKDINDILEENQKENSIISHDRLEELIKQLESMTIIQHLKNDTLDTLGKDYLKDNYSSIDDTVELIIERNNPSLGQRIINFFRK